MPPTSQYGTPAVNKLAAFGIIAFAGLIAFIFTFSHMFTGVDAGEIVVIQAPFTGNLTWYTTAGLKTRFFGKVTHYLKREQFWFSEKKDQGKPDDDSITVR